MSCAVVSTHLDDAVLSASSFLGPNTTVITVLAAVPPEPGVGAWDAEGGAATSAERVRERRDEDRAALAISGARFEHLDFADGQYSAIGLLPTPSRAAIADSLEKLLRGVPLVLGPAGIHNTDHKLVRAGLLDIRPDAVLYADLPYALHPAMGGFSLPPEMPRRGSPDFVELDEQRVAAKVEAVRCYETQLQQLERIFGDFATAQALGRECFWPALEVGRDDPCWCGSKRKHKKCHGR